MNARNSHGALMDSVWRAESDAQAGSHQLKLRIEAMFDNFAARHRVTFDDARTLLLDTGVRL